MILWLCLTRSWQRRTFGVSPDVKGPIKHLRKEIAEFEIAPKGEGYKELVDVVFLAWQIAHRCGTSPARFAWELWKKLYVNAFERSWPEPVDGEPCEHKR